MKRIKKFAVVLTAVILSFTLSACAVPYTYVSVLGEYVKDNSDEFTDLTAAIRKGIEEAVYSETEDEETRAYVLGLLGIEEDAPSANGPDEKDQSSEAKKPALPSSKKPDQTPDEKQMAPGDAGDERDSAEQEEQEGSTDAEDKDAGSEEAKEADSGSDKEKDPDSGSDKEKDTDAGSDIEKDEDPGSDTEVKASSSKIESPYVPEYAHVDKPEFEALCDAFKSAVEENDPEKVKSTYNEMYEKLQYIYTMNGIAFINFAIDVSDSYFKEEYPFMEQLSTECQDLFLTVCRDAVSSGAAEAFASVADETIVEEAREYEPLTDRAKELMEKETRLEAEYNTELDQIDSISYTTGDKTYTVEELYDDGSALSLLAFIDYQGFLEVYEGLLKSVNEKLGPIFLDLLKIRVLLSKELGYDSYADYCYKETFGRSYTTIDTEAYCNAIKKYVGKNYYKKAYPSIYNAVSFKTTFSTEEMLDILDGFTAGFDDFINRSLREFRDKQLYDIGSGGNRYAGSFTLSLYSEKLPFVFCNIDDTLDGLDTIEHEFGHFTNFLYEEQNRDAFAKNANYDVMEIHSNAMELICSNHYEEIVGEAEAEAAREYVLAKQLSGVIDGCIYDEFQREIYKNPTMNLQQINRLYGSILKEYGEQDIPGNQYLWVMINHTFESPMYYISYSISALSALEIWTVSQEDERRAIDIWMTVMKESDDEDYETVMEKAGLTPFTDTEGAVGICEKILDNF